MLRVSFFTSTTNVDSNMPRKFPTHRQRTHYSRDLKRCVIYQSEILNMKNTPIAINLNMPLRVVEQVKQTFDRVPVGLDHIVVPVVLTCYFLCINCWVVCLGQGFSGARRFARMDIMVWLGGFQYNSRPCRRIRRFMNKCGGGPWRLAFVCFACNMKKEGCVVGRNCLAMFHYSSIVRHLRHLAKIFTPFTSYDQCGSNVYIFVANGEEMGEETVFDWATFEPSKSAIFGKKNTLPPSVLQVAVSKRRDLMGLVCPRTGL